MVLSGGLKEVEANKHIIYGYRPSMIQLTHQQLSGTEAVLASFSDVLQIKFLGTTTKALEMGQKWKLCRPQEVPDRITKV